MKRSLPITPKRRSAFDELGFSATVEAVVRQAQELYAADNVPWVVGYSGGKDSTAVLQIVWMALQDCPRSNGTSPFM